MNETEINEQRAERLAKLTRVIEHANASVARWGAEKMHDATVTFYSRSREVSGSQDPPEREVSATSH